MFNLLLVQKLCFSFVVESFWHTAVNHMTEALVSICPADLFSCSALQISTPPHALYLEARLKWKLLDGSIKIQYDQDYTSGMRGLACHHF